MEQNYLRTVKNENKNNNNNIDTTESNTQQRPNCADIIRTVQYSTTDTTTGTTATTATTTPPISSLPTVLVVMTYKRVENLRLLLHSISDMMIAAPHRHTPLKLIVTQVRKCFELLIITIIY